MAEFRKLNDHVTVNMDHFVYAITQHDFSRHIDIMEVTFTGIDLVIPLAGDDMARFRAYLDRRIAKASEK